MLAPMRLLLALVMAVSMTACGSDEPAATPDDASASPSRPLPASAPSSTPPVASGPADDVRLRLACGGVELALAALQDDELPMAQRSAEAEGYLADAEEDLDDMEPPSQASADLRFEVTLLQAAILSGSALDTNGLNASYGANCVPLGFDAIGPD